MGFQSIASRVRGVIDGAVSGWTTGRIEKGRAPVVGDPFTDRSRAASPLDWWGLLEDPDIVLRKMGLDLSVYREILTDAHAASCVQSREAGVVCGEWRVEPRDGESLSVQAADACRDILDSLDMDRILREMEEAVLFGIAPLELKWMRDGALWYAEDLVGRPPEWFKFDTANRLRFLSRKNAWEGEELPPYSVLLAQHRATYRNPYGERVLSSCFWPCAFKRGGMKFWAEFTEKYGMPWAVGKVPPMTESRERQALLDTLTSMVRSTVAVISDGQAVELVTDASRSASADVYSRLVETCNAEMSKAILSQTLTTEIGQTGGAYAASQTHQEVRSEVIEADKRMIRATMHRLFQWFVDLNWPGAGRPEFVFFEEADPRKDIAERNEILQRSEPKLKFTRQYYMNTFNLEESDFDLVEPAPPALPPGDQPGGEPFPDGDPPAQDPDDAAGPPPDGDEGREPEEPAAGGDAEFSERDFLPTPETLAEEGAAKAESALAGVRRTVEGLLEDTEDYEAFVDELYRSYGSLDVTGLAQGLQSGIFQAELAGRLSAGRRTRAEFADQSLKLSFGLTPEDALRYFRAKGYRVTGNWREMWREAHAKAFTVAHCARMDVLADIRAAVDDALANGTTFADFRKSLTPILQRKGWWGPLPDDDRRRRENEAGGALLDPDVEREGSAAMYMAGSPARLRTIYDTNLSTAYAAGRYKQAMENKASAPLWQYHTVGDERVREQHAVLDGKVFSADDPFWDTMYPPSGWGCRCWVTPLTGAQVKEMGLEVESGTQAGPDGKAELLPEYQGLASPEFAYNPGKAAWRGIAPEYDDDPERWVPVGPGGLAPRSLADTPPELIREVRAEELTKSAGKSDADLVNEFLGEFGARIGRPAVWTDPVGNVQTISEDMFIDRKKTARAVAGEVVYKVRKEGRDQYLKLLAETLKDPLEIKLYDGVKHRGAAGSFPAPFLKYMKAFRVVGADGSVKTGYASFFWDGKQWTGETVFMPERDGYWQEQAGVLVYRKK